LANHAYDLVPESEQGSSVMLAEYDPYAAPVEPVMLSPDEALRLLDELIDLNGRRRQLNPFADLD